MDEGEIAAAARRIATCCDRMLLSVDRGETRPGAGDSLATPEFHTEALDVFSGTVPVADLKDLGVVFGEIAGRMPIVAARWPELDDPAWWHVRDHLAACHEAWGPYEFAVADRRRLSLVEKAAPPETPYDRLAALVTREATEELRAAAEWVATNMVDPGVVSRRDPGDGDPA